MVRLLVLLPETVTVHAVPADTYPAETVGVTLCVLLTDAVITPVDELTLILGFAVMLVAGVVADPLGIALICTLDKPSYPASGVIVCEDVVGLMFVLACICPVG